MSFAHIKKLHFFPPVNLSFVSFICRVPDTEYKRIEGKLFPLLHVLNKKETDREEINQYANTGYVACGTFKQKRSLTKSVFCKDWKLTEHQQLLQTDLVLVLIYSNTWKGISVW